VYYKAHPALFQFDAAVEYLVLDIASVRAGHAYRR
jgi:hypothetical protein